MLDKLKKDGFVSLESIRNFFKENKVKFYEMLYINHKSLLCREYKGRITKHQFRFRTERGITGFKLLLAGKHKEAKQYYGKTKHKINDRAKRKAVEFRDYVKNHGYPIGVGNYIR
jgi:hypothetical protein